MILQTDQRLNDSINSHGCYFMSILFLVNKCSGLPLSTVSIRSYFNKCVELGYITDNSHYTAFINSVGKIFNYLGLKVKYTNKHESPKRNCAKNEIEILCLKDTGSNKKHFVVGDGKGHVAYNPMGIDNPNYKLYSKRIFKIC